MGHSEPGRRLAEFAHDLSYEHLPQDVVGIAKLHLRDTLGVALAALPLASSRAILTTVTGWAGVPEATVWSDGTRLPATSAALVNGALAHSLDFDDTHVSSITHPSACIVPAALAAGEVADADGATLIAAIVAGYEVAARVGLAAAGGFQARGFHATALCGALGAVAAAGRVMGLDVQDLAHAFGIVASQAAGIQAFLADGSWTKRLHAGWAAHCGLVATQLAGAGFVGPKQALDGTFGLLASHVPPNAAQPARLTEALGERWETRALAVKPYPCCHFNHAFMDAALAIVRAEKIAPREIEEIEVLVPEPEVPIVCEPWTVKLRPPSSYAALFSLPYCVAFIFERGRFELDDVNDESIRDPGVLALAARVRYRATPASPSPATFPGTVRVRLSSGRVLAHEESVNRGHPGNPMSAADLWRKFQATAGRVAPVGRLERFAAEVETLEAATSRGFAETLSAVLQAAPDEAVPARFEERR